MEKKVRVLFIEAKPEFGPVQNMTTLLMRYFDQKRVEVHVAYTLSIEREKTPLFNALKAIPNFYLGLTNLGPVFSRPSKIDVAIK